MVTMQTKANEIQTLISYFLITVMGSIVLVFKGGFVTDILGSL